MEQRPHICGAFSGSNDIPTWVFLFKFFTMPTPMAQADVVGGSWEAADSRGKVVDSYGKVVGSRGAQQVVVGVSRVAVGCSG
jgi:hypothetical protein